MPSRAHSIERPGRSQMRRAVAVRARLEHPHLVPVRVVKGPTGQPKLVQSKPHAPTLAAALARGPLKPKAAVAIVSGVARGVGALEVNGLVPRNIVPARVFVERGRGGVLADYGIPPEIMPLARPQPDPDLAFRSPEERTGDELSPRSSVYSLGALLIAALTGAPSSESLEPEMGARERDVPRTLRAVSARALATEPERRYATAREFARAAVAAVKADELDGAGTARAPRPSREVSLARMPRKAAAPSVREAEKEARAATARDAEKKRIAAERDAKVAAADRKAAEAEAATHQKAAKAEAAAERSAARLAARARRSPRADERRQARSELTRATAGIIATGGSRIAGVAGRASSSAGAAAASVRTLGGRVSLPRIAGWVSVPRLTGRVRARAAAVAGTGLVAVACVAGASELLGNDGNAHVTLTDGKIVLRLPAGWERSHVGARGFGPLSGGVSASQGDSTSLTAAVMREPSSTAAAIGRMATAATAATPGRLGRIQVARYYGLQPTQGTHAIAYVLNTSGPSVLIVCEARGSSSPGALRDCAVAASGIRVKGDTPISPAAADARLQAANDALRRLGSSRVEARARIASAPYAESQADAAHDLQESFYRASRQVEAIRLPGGAAEQLVRRLHDAGDAYGALAATTRSGDQQGYDSARAQVTATEEAVIDGLPGQPARLVPDQR